MSKLTGHPLPIVRVGGLIGILLAVSAMIAFTGASRIAFGPALAHLKQVNQDPAPPQSPPSVTLNPDNLLFTDQVVRRTSAAKRITVRNTGKPIGIQTHIGRRPIAAFGNSDGDLQMLQWTAAGSGARFCLYVRHTDAEREYAYDRTDPLARLDKGLDEAAQRGWTVVDMKKDWKRIFPADK